ncbi:hypothetical protein C8J57DRAFT_1533804 [Mycena rebaudengoi]|nr:hypothetical protein C8J57DRAFT_1533804 [Mycena rebaudengoi]
MSSQKYPKVTGYFLVEKIGGGAYSRVFHAVNMQEYCVATCKVPVLTSDTTEKVIKAANKEMCIHTTLKHANILKFLNATVVGLKYQDRFVLGIYMLLSIGIILYTLLPSSASRFYFVANSLAQPSANTPWEELMEHIQEYLRYMTGKIFSEELWNCFGKEYKGWRIGT